MHTYLLNLHFSLAKLKAAYGMPMRQYILVFIFIGCCTAIESRAENNELHIISTYDHATLEKLLNAFGKREGVKINATYMNQYNLKQRMMEMNESRWAPDAVIVPSDHLGLHRFIEYSEVSPALFKTNISPRIWSTCLSDGKFYGVPLVQGNFLMLYYNKSLVKEPARDWQTMQAQKTELDAKGIQTISWPIHEPFFFLPFLGAYGGWPLSDGKIQLNSPAMVATLDFYKTLISYKLFKPDTSDTYIPQLFKAGKYAYTISGEWNGADLFQALGEKLGVSALPMAEGKKMRPAFSTYAMAFPYNSLQGSKKAQLIKLVDYLQSTKIQRQIAEEMNAIPVDPAVFSYLQKNAPTYVKQTLALMADTKPLPADEAMSFIWAAIAKGLEREQQGASDSKSTALFMQQLAERYVRNAQPTVQPTTH